MIDTSPLQPDTPGNSDKSPLAVALLCALALHLLLLAVPQSLNKLRHRDTPTLHINLIHNTSQPMPLPKSVEKPASKPEQAEKPREPKKLPTAQQPKPAQKNSAPAPEKARNTQRKSSPPQEASTIHNRNPATQTPSPTEKLDGAKSRSTVFDPRLAGRLAQERNKVKKFTPRSAEYMTSTGTFIQNGNKCVEVKKLIAIDIDSNLSQEFKIKCTKRRRPQADIDRLAEKYGIP